MIKILGYLKPDEVKMGCVVTMEWVPRAKEEKLLKQ